VSWDEQDVVEGEGFPEQAHNGPPAAVGSRKVNLLLSEFNRAW